MTTCRKHVFDFTIEKKTVRDRVPVNRLISTTREPCDLLYLRIREIIYLGIPRTPHGHGLRKGVRQQQLYMYDDSINNKTAEQNAAAADWKFSPSRREIVCTSRVEHAGWLDGLAERC